MASASTLFHLMGALRRAAGRVFLTFILTLVIVGGLTEALHYFLSGPNGTLTHIVAAALGIGWAIALSLFVLVFEVVKGLVTSVGEAAKNVEHQLGEAGKMVGGVVESVEHKAEGR